MEGGHGIRCLSRPFWINFVDAVKDILFPQLPTEDVQYMLRNLGERNRGNTGLSASLTAVHRNRGKRYLTLLCPVFVLSTIPTTDRLLYALFECGYFATYLPRINVSPQ
jgi:hypothetical protein